METNKLVQAFETELNLTEEGFKTLIEQKKNLVIDVSTEDGFKLARKERSEQNKILGNIDRLAIDGKKSVDEARNSLKERVEKIYAPTVTAFLNEDNRRKEEKARKEREEAERIEGIRAQINSIRQFSTNLIGKTSDDLQSIIEAVDMIDVSENFAELTQEAMSVKKETLIELNHALSSVIQNEQLAAEREQLRIEREAQEEQKRLDDLRAKAQERLNNLMMIPAGFFGKSSGDINKKIVSLTNYQINPEEFGEMSEMAKQSKKQVISQLTIMSQQQEAVEASQAKELAENEAKAKHEEKPLEPLPLPEELPEESSSLKEPITHARMIELVNFWASEYGIHGTEYNDLMNILNQLKA